LPDVVVAAPAIETACLINPEPGSTAAAQLAAGQVALVRGLSADESWWNVVNPEKPAESCWLPKESVSIGGDISTLPLIEPPVQSAGSASSNMFLEITRITTNTLGHYVVEYVARGFTEQLPGTHIHFFFDTVPPDQVGISGGGNRLMYGGPSPFTGYLVTDRPPEATQLCALVANPNHSVIANSGNCLALPDASVQPTTSAVQPGTPPDKDPGY
jgi:hypothetical protein